MIGGYTAAALSGVAITVLLDLLVLRVRLLRRRVFWASYAIICLFQLATNGVLTTQRVVIYDRSQILGLRLVGAPVEDLLFGFGLVLLTLDLWVLLGRRGVQRDPVRVPPRLPAHLRDRWIHPTAAERGDPAAPRPARVSGRRR